MIQNKTAENVFRYLEAERGFQGTSAGSHLVDLAFFLHLQVK